MLWHQELKNMFGPDLRLVQLNRHNQTFIYVCVCAQICTHMCICMHIYTHVYLYSSYICIYIQEIHINHLWHINHIWHITLNRCGLFEGWLFRYTMKLPFVESKLSLSWKKPECALGPVFCLQADG